MAWSDAARAAAAEARRAHAQLRGGGNISAGTARRFHANMTIVRNQAKKALGIRGGVMTMSQHKAYHAALRKARGGK